jgi:glucosamine-6-phosphate deaminase
MRIQVYPDARAASRAAADELEAWLGTPGVTTLVTAAGNSPLELYRLIAARSLPVGHLHVFALDEYVGVPPEDPRTCANLLRRAVAEAWGIPADHFHALSSRPEEALPSLWQHEEWLSQMGGIDVLVLGLGRNGHLGFNEPGSAPDSPGRVVDLEPVSIEANARWFDGDHAPARGVTLGLGRLLAARRVLLVAFGQAKADAVRQAVMVPPTTDCPASWLQGHPAATFFVDDEAAAGLPVERRRV